MPRAPARVLAKKSRCPSMERFGAKSADVVLIGAPRLTGGSHGLSSEARRVTQMSSPPSPPGRSEVKYIASSSFDSCAFCSLDAELTTGPRFTGADHSENALAEMASMLNVMGASGAQANTQIATQ